MPPWVVVIPDAPDMPPTTFTAVADKVPPPSKVSADELFELSIKLHLVRETADDPLMTVAPLAVGSRLSTQPPPPVATATARAETVSCAELNSAENSLVCG